MRERLLPWAPAAVWAAVIFAASSRPSVPTPSFWGADKLSHFTAYAVLEALLARAASRSGAPLGLALLAGLLYAASDEWHQSFVPGRNSDARDWIADALGVGVAGLLAARQRARGA